MALSVEIDGQQVPLAQCGWLLRNACGCIVAAAVAVVTGSHTLATPEQAHRHFAPRKDSRARQERQGMRVELITMVHYHQHIGAKWECDQHQPASA